MNSPYRPNRLLTRLAFAAGLAVTAASLHAQTPPPPADTETVVLDPFVVSGDKFGKTVQEIASSIGFVSSEAIEEAKLLNYADTFRLVANVRDSAFVDGGFVIRGVNSDGVGGVSGGEAMASLYIDGVAQTQQGGRRGASGLWDVEQVAIFRGPQSTVSGRNSLAGAIYVKTKDPTFTSEGAVRAGYADYNTVNGAIAWSAPINEKLAFRVTAQASRADSTIEYPDAQWRTYDGADDFETYRDWQFRGKLLWQPDGEDGLRAVLTYSHAYVSTVLTDALGPTYDPSVSSVFDRKWIGFGLRSARGFSARDGFTHNASLDVTKPIGENVGLSSITTYTNALVRIPSLVSTRYDYGYQDEDEFAQELRVNYSSDRIRAVAGLYYLYGNEHNQVDAPNFGFTTRTRTRGDIDNGNLALFGEADYRLDDTWTLVAGGRLEHAYRDTDQLIRSGPIPVDMAGAAGAPNYDRELVPLPNSTVRVFNYDETVFLPKVGLSYAFDRRRSLSLTYQRGYRGGGAGFNAGLNQSFTFDPEYTNNFEAAYRSLSADQKLTFNANVFYTDWTDMQVRFNGPLNSNIASTVNAGAATWWGSEVELAWRPRTDLTFTASLGYVNTEFKEFLTTNNINYEGARFPEAPEWNHSVAVFYRHESGFFARADLEYVGDFFSQILFVPQTDAIRAGDYYTFNPAIGYRRDNWSVTLYANNLFDEDYETYNEPFNSPTAGGDRSDASTLGIPRVVGVAFDYAF